MNTVIPNPQPSAPADDPTCGHSTDGRHPRTRSAPAARLTHNWFLLPGIGGSAWVVWAWAYLRTAGWWDWPTIALLFSPFVIVPLGLSIVQRPETGPVAPMLTTLRRLVPLGAGAMAVSFLLIPGWQAALLTLPWLALTTALGIVGVLRTVSRRGIEPGMGTDAALVFLAMGSIWVTTSRLGANPLGYDDLLVLLTAVHLHFAGFALPLAAGAGAARYGGRAVVPAAVVAAVPATGLGVALGGAAEWIAATFMGLTGLATAAVLLRTAFGRRRASQLGGTTSAGDQRRSGLGRTLIAVSSASLVGAMVLGIGWAWAIRFGWEYLDVLEMARVHGMLNAFGFAFVGLVGLNLLPPLTTPRRRVIARLRVASRKDLETMARNAAHDVPTSGASAARCTSEASVALPNGFDAARDALRHWVGHDAAGIRRWPERPEIAEGTTLALSTPIGPVAIAATLRITEVIDEPNRFGFTYAALSDHPETGQQTMLIERAPDGTARATVATSCGPWLVLSRMMPSVTERLQNRIREQYLAGVARWPHG